MVDYPASLRPDDYMPDARRAVALAVVGFEPSSAICAETAAKLQRLLGEIHPSLPEAIGPQPLSGGGITLPDVLRNACTSETGRRRWDVLGADWVPFEQRRADGERAPQCVLILPAQRLVEKEPAENLIRDLTEAGSLFASYLILFLDETGQLLLPGTPEEKLRPWLERFRTLVDPGWVSLYLVSPVLETGRPIDSDELCEVTALAMCADLILPDRDSPRLLTGRPTRPTATLATFGMRALRFDPQRVADRFVKRLVRDLLLRTSLAEGSMRTDVADDLPSSAERIFHDVFPDNPEFSERSIIAAGPDGGRIAADVPVLVGPDFKLTVELGGMAKGIRLERVPRGQWLEQVYEWDFLVRTGRLPRLLQRVTSSVEPVASRETDKMRRELAKAFASPAGASSSVGLCDELADRVHARYRLNVRRGGARSLADGLGALNRALASIPHFLSLAARALVLVCLQLALGIAVWNTSPSNLRTGLLAGLGLILLLTLVFPFYRRLRAEARAQTVRDRALAEIEGRAQLAFCTAMQREFAALHNMWSAELQRDREILTACHDALSALTTGADSPPDTDRPPDARSSCLIRWLPEAWRNEELYGHLVGHELADEGGGDLIPRFSEFLQGEVGRAVRSEIAAAVVADRAIEFAREELIRRLRTRYQLWHLLRKRLEEGPPDPEIAARAIEPLGREFPLVCLRGTVGKDALLDPHRCEKYFVAPRVLRQFKPSVITGEPVDSAMDNAVAAMARVELMALGASTKEFDSPPPDPHEAES